MEVLVSPYQYPGPHRETIPTRPNVFYPTLMNSGFPAAGASISPWIPGLTTPSSRPLRAYKAGQRNRMLTGERAPVLRFVSPPMHIVIARGFLTCLFASIVVSIPSVCWAIALRITVPH